MKDAFPSNPLAVLTAEGHWRTRPGAPDFVSLAQAVLATVSTQT